MKKFSIYYLKKYNEKDTGKSPKVYLTKNEAFVVDLIFPYKNKVVSPSLTTLFMFLF